MDEICRIADEEAVDAIIIAGDVFDAYNPPAESESLFYRTMTRLADGGRRGIVVIAGNHDSPDRLIASDPYARALGITTLGYPKDIPALYDAGKARTACVESAQSFIRLRLPRAERILNLLALPYPSESRLKELLTDDVANEEQASVDYNRRVREFMAQGAARFRDGEANIVASHLFVSGGQESDSERQIQVGGVYTVEPLSFPASSYVALGHLHREQEMRGVNDTCIRYAGSVLQYSFSEAGQKKSVTIVELRDGKISHYPIPLSGGRMLRRWQIGNGIEELERRLAEVDAADWLSVALVLDEPLEPDYLNNLRRAHPGLINCTCAYRWESGDPNGAAPDAVPVTIEEQFRRFVRARYEEPCNDEVLRLFLELAGTGDEETQTS
ncbi:MAG: Nuclease SbcCD subunit [Chlorobi bacterium]|nr:Nuclease SbcCD subunit [Chlorobiota bacterium]